MVNRNYFSFIHTTLILACILFFSSCNGEKLDSDVINSINGKSNEAPNPEETHLDPSVTVGSEHISAVSVVLKGKANLDSSAPSDLMVGFQYSLSAGILPSNSTTVEATDADSQYNYSRGITGLKPETTYYYRSIVRMSGQDYYGETRSFKTKALSSMLETKDASDITNNSVKMNAKLDLTDVRRNSIEYGFYWGASENNLNNYVKGDNISGNTYSASLSGLSHKTQYWYKSYLKIDGRTFYGELKVFLTDVQPVTGVSLDKTVCTVHTIDSTFTLTPTVFPSDAANKSVSWKSSKTSVATVDEYGKVTAKGNGTTTITVTTQDQSKTATCKITVAQWVTGIILNLSSIALNEGQTIILTPTISPSNANNKMVTWSSDNTSVTTIDQNGKVTAVARGATILRAIAKDGSGINASCSVHVYKPTNLSAGGGANCYIVASSGDYSFLTVKGNSSISVGVVASAEVLWESYGTSEVPSVGSIISSVSYSNNTIFFSTPSTLKNGNAVIAAKDASGNILWSWHIWVCKDFDPVLTRQVYYNNAGTMMDRNLGATSATPGDVGALGLLYQWGRKDPFLGSSSISSNTQAASTLIWPSPVSPTSSIGTMEYAIGHPTTVIKENVLSCDWYWPKNTDFTRWQPTKTIYDPCPPGWRIPDGGPSGVWSKATSVTSGYFSYSFYSKGMNFRNKFGSAGTIWYPAAGGLDRKKGSLDGVGSSGHCWSCTRLENSAYPYPAAHSLFFFDAEQVHPSDFDLRAGGYSVRCQKE